MRDSECMKSLSLSVMRKIITFLKNSNMSNKVKSILAVLLIIILLGIAGRIDYTEQTMYNMSDKPYNEIKDTFTDDEGNEKDSKYFVLVCAKDITEANKIMDEYLKQGFDMKLDGIVRTKILDVI